MTILFENQKDLLIRLRKIRLNGFANELENQFMNSLVYADSTLEDRLSLCIEAQESYTKERRCAYLIKNAKFKDSLRMSDLSLTKEYGLSEQVKNTLTSTQWISKGVNILVSGPCGVGKASLINAVGYNCCLNGISVKNFRTDDFFNSLINMPMIERVRVKEYLKKIKVILFDDFGMNNLNEEHRKELFDIIDDRYRIGSTIIATQLKKSGVKMIMGNDAKGEATIDRFFNPCIEIELNGPSRRSANS